jgi:type VI secretion system protein ImpI
MFQKTRAGYLDGPASFREAFQDLHSHEKATFAAMQKALSRLTEDLTPESVEDKVSGSFGSHKGKAWELYVQRWNAKTEHRENGMLDVFFSDFSEIYDTMTKK